MNVRLATTASRSPPSTLRASTTKRSPVHQEHTSRAQAPLPLPTALPVTMVHSAKTQPSQPLVALAMPATSAAQAPLQANPSHLFHLITVPANLGTTVQMVRPRTWLPVLLVLCKESSTITTRPMDFQTTPWQLTPLAVSIVLLVTTARAQE